MFLRNGFNINAWLKNGISILEHVILLNNKLLLQLLLNHKADINLGYALQIAMKDSHTFLIQLLLDHGADINLRNVLQAAAAKSHESFV